MAWLYFNMRKVNITGVIDIPAVLEVLSIVLEIEKESFFIDSSVWNACSSWFFHS